MAQAQPESNLGIDLHEAVNPIASITARFQKAESKFGDGEPDDIKAALTGTADKSTQYRGGAKENASHLPLTDSIW